MTQSTRNAPRSPGLRRGVSAFGALLIVCVGCISLAPAGAIASGVPASRPLVVLLHDHIARTSPNLHARTIENVESLRPLTRVRTVLPALR
jgi:hypothetical protein